MAARRDHRQAPGRAGGRKEQNMNNPAKIGFGIILFFVLAYVFIQFSGDLRDARQKINPTSDISSNIDSSQSLKSSEPLPHTSALCLLEAKDLLSNHPPNLTSEKTWKAERLLYNISSSDPEYRNAQLLLQQIYQIRQAEQHQQVEQEASALGLRWRYSEEPDKMGRGTIKHAMVRSLNEVEFDFPYQGAQFAMLCLRMHPKLGKDVFLSIKRGQFLCDFRGCRVAVRFDNGKAQNFSAVGPADHSTTMLFLRDYDRFLAVARKSKKVYIEAQFFRQGTRVFEFDISGLNW